MLDVQLFARFEPDQIVVRFLRGAMAENDEAAAAAGRLEQALDRIAKASIARRLEVQETQSKVDTLAERLDLMIAELRAALSDTGSGHSA